jgi:hypothetical protein
MAQLVKLQQRAPAAVAAKRYRGQLVKVAEPSNGFGQAMLDGGLDKDARRRQEAIWPSFFDHAINQIAVLVELRLVMPGEATEQVDSFSARYFPPSPGEFMPQVHCDAKQRLGLLFLFFGGLVLFADIAIRSQCGEDLYRLLPKLFALPLSDEPKHGVFVGLPRRLVLDPVQ